MMIRVYEISTAGVRVGGGVEDFLEFSRRVGVYARQHQQAFRVLASGKQVHVDGEITGSRYMLEYCPPIEAERQE